MIKVTITNEVLNRILRMVELHAQRVVELSSSSLQEQAKSSLSFLNTKERRFLQYLFDNQIKTFTPVEMAGTMNVTNRTITNWCSKLAQNGFLHPNQVNKRIRSYTVTGFGKDLQIV